MTGFSFTRPSAWPTTPSMIYRSGTFDPDAEAFLGHWPTWAAEWVVSLDELESFYSQIEDAQDQIFTARDEAQAAASIAQNVVLAMDNFKGAWINLTGPLPQWVSLYHAGMTWMTLTAIADATLSEPSKDNSDYFPLGAMLVKEAAPQLGGPLDSNEHQIQASVGTPLVSAATISIPADGNLFAITGTTGISAINTTGRPGTEVTFVFSDALTLTHSSNLILPGDTDYTTVAGSVLKFAEESAGVFRCTGVVSSGGGGANFEYSSGTAASLSGESYVEIEIDPTKDTLIELDNASLSADEVIKLLFYNGGSLASVLHGSLFSVDSSGPTVEYPLDNKNTIELTDSIYGSYYANGIIHITGGAKINANIAGRGASNPFVSILSGFLYGTWDRIRLVANGTTFDGGTIRVKEVG